MSGRPTVPTPGNAGERLDEQLYRAMYDVHHGHLVAYALRLTNGDTGWAEDIVAEAMHRAAQDPGRHGHRPAALRPWLTVLVRKVFLDTRRGDPAGAVPAPADRDAWATTTVLGAMRSLSSTHCGVLIDLYYRGMSLEQTAAAHGVPVGTVKSRLYYALRALRIVLQAEP